MSGVPASARSSADIWPRPPAPETMCAPRCCPDGSKAPASQPRRQAEDPTRHCGPPMSLTAASTGHDVPAPHGQPTRGRGEGRQAAAPCAGSPARRPRSPREAGRSGHLPAHHRQSAGPHGKARPTGRAGLGKPGDAASSPRITGSRRGRAERRGQAAALCSGRRANRRAARGKAGPGGRAVLGTPGKPPRCARKGGARRPHRARDAGQTAALRAERRSQAAAPCAGRRANRRAARGKAGPGGRAVLGTPGKPPRCAREGGRSGRGRFREGGPRRQRRLPPAATAARKPGGLRAGVGRRCAWPSRSGCAWAESVRTRRRPRARR